MDAELILRLILTCLFIITVVTRRFFERKAAQRITEGTKQDLDTKGRIFVQSLLLTLSNLAMIVFLIKPEWMAWSTVPFPDWLQ